ncbi:hypothetical protein E3N88_08969 [Mikania micrantha]|uniref:Uncharacterized protein n=1 Tax=Mikania micrantha TaxID=192012 RepID=A0A5N6PK23_9ASTR|nr:hypothetical protein E3N88_08969 [Mikania micrantha]
MSNKRNNFFTNPKPPPEDVPATSSNEEDIRDLLANPAVILVVNMAVNHPVKIPTNFSSIEEWDEEGNDVYWNWAFNNLFPDNQDQEEPIVEQQLGHEEEPEDKYVPDDPWAFDDDGDEETLNRWRNHDPWDCSFDSIFND